MKFQRYRFGVNRKEKNRKQHTDCGKKDIKVNLQVNRYCKKAQAGQENDSKEKTLYNK